MEPQRIVTAELMGGVGNQLFQVAIAYSFSKKFNYKLLFERGQFSGCRQGSVPSSYYNSLYQKLEFVDSLKNVEKEEVKEKTWSYHDIYQDIDYTKNIIFRGYFQSDRYFREYTRDIRRLFIPDCGSVSFIRNNSNLFNKFPELQYEDNDRVLIGVRRGDYVTYPHIHYPCGMSYYTHGLKYYNNKKRTYYINSDDFSWCKKHFIDNDFCEFKFLEDCTDIISLLAGTLFKNYIISNSSFHWWSSFLSISESPNIIAPDLWIAEPNYESVYRDGMIVIHRNVEI